MHPMFVKLFLGDDDDPLAEEQQRRHLAKRARRNRSWLSGDPPATVVTDCGGDPPGPR
jgi:hypothetical protein